MLKEFDEKYQDALERSILLKEIERLKEKTRMILVDGLGNLYHVREEDAEPISGDRKNELLSQLNADLSLLNGGNAAPASDQGQPAPSDQPAQPTDQSQVTPPADPSQNQPQTDASGNPVVPNANPNPQPAVDPSTLPPLQ